MAVTTATLLARLISVVEPLTEFGDLFVVVRRIHVLDGDIGRRDQHRLGVRELLEAVPAVVVAYSCRADSAEGHRLDEEVDVRHVDAAAPVGKLPDEPVDRRLVT